MKKTLIIIFIVAISGTFLFGADSFSVAKKETIRIGASWPLTGNLAFMGEGLKNAIIMAKEQLGDTKYNYELIFEDDQLNPKMTATTINKLINMDKVDAVISQGSGPGHVTTPIATKHKVIHFGLALAPDIAKGNTNFIHWTSAAEHSRVMINEMKKRGIKKVGLFGMNNEDVLIHRDDFRERAKKAGITIVFDEIFNVGEKDLRGLIAKAKEGAKKNPPDIYVVVAMSPEIEILTKQMREAGLNTPLTTFSSFEATPEMGLFEGYWYVSPAEPTNKFIEDYKAKYGKYPSVCAGNSYDMFNLIVKAVESAKSGSKPTSKQIAEELRKIKNFPGALGNLTVRQDGIVISEAKVKMIKDGKPVVIEN
ncbi:MAG: ABC transporter substrate-binding protein [Nitrospirae bacterium]|nr:ABC transporter substrate-binding protein [Nitrospirota bacterium]